MSGKIGANTQVRFSGRLIFIPEFSLTHSVDGIVKLFWQNFCKQLPTNFGLYILLLSLVTVIDFPFDIWGSFACFAIINLKLKTFN